MIDFFPFSETRVFKFLILLSTLPILPIGQRMGIDYKISTLLKADTEKEELEF